MSMLPIFLIGFILGIIVMYAIYNCRKDMLSKTKIKLQEAEIIRQNKDNEMLHNLINKLYAKIDELEKNREENFKLWK